MLRIEGYENCHCHSDVSLLDGFGMVEEYAERARDINQRYVCITDHGMMGVIPRQIKACEKYGRIPVFGVELYVNKNQPARSDFEALSADDKRNIVDENNHSLRKSYHILAIAITDEGYRNLVQLHNWGHLEGFYYRPRINHEQLQRHKDGIIFTSGCYNSEVGQAFDRRGPDAAEDVIRQQWHWFGNNYYLEFMLLDFVKQKPYNKFIVDMHAKLGIPVMLSNDVHYCYQEDSKYQRYMLMIQKNMTVRDIEQKLQLDDKQEIFELQDANLWLKSEEELNAKWLEMYSDVIPDEVFAEAKRNSVRICERVNVNINRDMKLPYIEKADEILKEELKSGLKRLGLLKREYVDRIKEEYQLIRRKGFSSYFLIQKSMTDKAREICPGILGWGSGDEAVGPGRGSAVGSLACYALGITDVDPLRHDLLFSRFLSEARGGKSLKLRFTKPPIGKWK